MRRDGSSQPATGPRVRQEWSAREGTVASQRLYLFVWAAYAVATSLPLVLRFIQAPTRWVDAAQALYGLYTLCFGLALVTDWRHMSRGRREARWLGWVLVVAGLGLVIAAVGHQLFPL